MPQKITKVIIPVAGSGTRFLPATKAQPKEMLAVIDKPVIQYLVEEAVEAGMTDIIFVTGRSKRAIEDHFDAAPELEAHLEANGKKAILEQVRRVSKLARYSFVRQQAPLGDGDAILCAEHLVGNEPVAVMFGDDIFVGTPRLTQIKKTFEEKGEVVAALEEVPKEEVTRYGVVGGTTLEDGVLDINKIIEKPKLEEAPSNLIFMGTYIITPEIFKELRTLKATHQGELRIANALESHLKNHPIYGVKVEGKRHDCGDKMGYLKTIVEFALTHPEVRDEFKAFLKKTAESL
jgi:UTP--glucose-1-phosphate uridylyltransferase